MSAAVADVLDAAAVLLERDGWCQGQNRDQQGRCCAAEAIRVAADGGALYVDAMFAVVATVRREHAGVALWNDAPARTASEVIGRLRQVAASERAA